MKLKYFIFAFTAMLSCFAVSVNAQNVAKVGDTEYAKIDDAIANCTNGTTLTLLADLNLSDILTINKAITLNGNGKTLTSSAERAINVSGAEANGVKIQNLTINASGERAINVIQNATNVTVDNVTATAKNYTVNVAASAPNAVVAIKNSNLTGLNVVNVAAPQANVTINGGTITCNDQNEAEDYAALALNKDGKNATIAATDVTFDIKGDSKKANNGAEGGVITIDGKTDEVVVDVAYIKSESNYYYAYTSIEAAIEAAKAGETIVLLRDVTVAEKITIAKSITLDGNGKTLTYTGNGTSARAIDVPAADGVKLEVTIKNLTVDCTSSYCQRGINYNEDGKLTLEGVTVKGTKVTYALNLPGSSDNCEVAINNSSLTGNIALNVWGENSIINAENTTFTAVDNNPEEGYAAVKLNNDGTTSAEGSVINITGGKIDVTGSAAEDTEAVSNGTSTGAINISESTVVNGKIATLVAVIRYADGNSYSFETIEDAIAKAKAGETITLIRDVTTSEIIVLDKAITFDGNGKTLTSTAGRAINVSGADGVTIKNLTINASGERAINVIQNATNVTVENVTATAANYTVNVAASAPNAVVAISNSTLSGLCTVNVSAASAEVTVDNSTVNCNDNNTTAGESYAALSLNKEAVGGSIVATNSTINVTEGSDSMKGRNGAENGTVTINGSTDGVTVMVAVITYEGSTNYYSFATLADAVEYAKAGDVVTLIRDVKINELVKIEKAITLDLNGKKVTSTAKKAFEVYANATIKNGAIEAAQRCVDTRKAVELTLTNVTLIADEYTTHGNPQPLTIGGSENGTKVVMTNVDISAAAGYGIITFVETELTATNSTIGGYNALYVKPGSDNSKFNFANSDLSGTIGNDVEGNSFSTIAVRANNVAVNVDAESTVTANGDHYYAISFIGTSENTTTGSSVTVAGEITGNILDDPNGNTVKVKAEYADELAAAGYATIEAENGLVAAIKAVAKIGETYYATLAEAFAAAQDGETITVLQDIEVSETIVNTKKVTLDLNDKTVTGTPSEAKAYAVITNYGTLTISNGSVICNHTLAGSTGYAVNTITNCGTLTIEDATIENHSTAQYQIGYAIDNNSTSADAVVNIKGGKVIASGSLYYDGIRQFCNSQTKENSVVVSGGEVSTIWMQNPSDGATKNTKDVKGSIAISGGKVGVLSLEPSANFEAAVTGGHFGEISYFQTAEGRDLKGFVTGGTFDKLIDETLLAMGYQLTGDAAPYIVENTGKVTKLELVDGEFTEFVNKEEVTVDTLTYKRNVLNTWVPIYVPFEIPVSMLAEKFYVARINDVRRTDNNNDGELDDFDMEIIFIHGGNADGSGKTLKANYPYFIKSKSGQTETMEITLTNATLYAAKENVFDCTTMTEKFEIKGNCRLMQANEFDPKNQYTVLTTGEWGHTTSALKPFRFYMTKSSRYEDEPAAPMNSMRITVRGEEDENGATIIYDVVEDSLDNNGNDFIYDLQGRRVSEPKKGGIYIKNGKKILF